MDKGIIILENLELRKLITLNIEMYTNTTLLSMHNADDCTEHLKNERDISLIVCVNNVGEEFTMMKVFYYVSSNKLNIPIICLGACSKLATEKSVKIFAEYGKEVAPIVKAAAKMIGIGAEQMAELEVEEHYPVPVRYLNMMDSSPVDVYKVKANRTRKIIFKQNAKINHDLIRDMIIKGMDELFVHKLDRLRFVDRLSDHTIQRLRKVDLTSKDRVETHMAVFKASREMIAEVGLEEKSIEAADVTIQVMAKEIVASNRLSELMDILQRLEGTYLYNHTILNAYLGHFVVGEMEFSTKKYLETICFSAYFHDITLYTDAAAMISSNLELRNASFDTKSEKRVLEHAFNAAQLLEDHPCVPFGAIELITQHHGQKNGIGFNNGQPGDISPVAMVFMVVESYVGMILKAKADPKFDLKLGKIRLIEKYTKSFYKKALDILIELPTKLPKEE